MNRGPIDHDGLFKLLLSTFFLDFLELFAPDLAAQVEPGSIQLLDKEVFHDLADGGKRIPDLVASLRLRGEPSAVLVHDENQAQWITKFEERMFEYMAMLWLRHRVPIYPIAVLSFRHRTAQKDNFDITLPGLEVLRFRFRVVQLPHLDWRAFLRRPNPVAAALMSKMRIAPADRPRVKLECLRMIATLRLDPARTRLVSGFVDQYLRLSPAEQKLFQRELGSVRGPEKERVMEIKTSWSEEGRQEGLWEGRVEVLLRQLSRRIGAVPDRVVKQIGALPIAALDDLAEGLLDFQTAGDLTRWMAAHGARPEQGRSARRRVVGRK